MPPSGNGNRGNGNPFKRNSPNDPNGNQKGNNSGGPQPFWKSPWLWGVLLVVMAVAGFQLFAAALQDRFGIALSKRSADCGRGYGNTLANGNKFRHGGFLQSIFEPA